MNGHDILIIGGTGSLGKALVTEIFNSHQPKSITIFSRNEYNQWLMLNEFSSHKSKLSFVLGDVRDKEAIQHVMKNKSIVFNLSAIKHVPNCETNLEESVKTNVNGALNSVDSVTDQSIIIHTSTDKAVYPISNYGVTKSLAEKIILNGGSHHRGTKFHCIRFGNFVGSSGSVIELFKKQIKNNEEITLTNPQMSRFWISLSEAAKFCLEIAPSSENSAIFVPKMVKWSMDDLVQTLKNNINYHVNCSSKIRIIGDRKGEKLHEVLFHEDEFLRIKDCGTYYKTTKEIQSPQEFFEMNNSSEYMRLTPEQIKEYLQKAGVV